MLAYNKFVQSMFHSNLSVTYLAGHHWPTSMTMLFPTSGAVVSDCTTTGERIHIQVMTTFRGALALAIRRNLRGGRDYLRGIFTTSLL